MERLEMTLTKTVKYNLKPFGRFSIKVNCSDATRKKPHVIDFYKLSFDHRKGMPYTGDDELLFTKFMKKHKTDILVDDYGSYFTRIGDNWVEVGHEKLAHYSMYLRQTGKADNEETWKEYVEERKIY